MGAACPDDNDLVAFADGALADSRRDSIARHIDGCAVCRSLAAEAVDAGDDALVKPTTLRRGDSLGRYTVLEKLGSGGLGDVYLAYDPELDRRVAVKLLRSDIASGEVGEQLRGRLVREARVLAKLAHPNVVHVYDVGTDAGRVFISMEHVDGPTLAAWLKEHADSWTVVRDIFVQAAHGLMAAHEAGIVHRDFKPANVLIGRDGRPRVLDFGLARSSTRAPALGLLPGTSSRSDRDDVSASGTITGTPAYMAPEQHEMARVDARADQFAFCVSMFEALFGCRPFAGRNLDELAHAKKAGTIAALDSPLRAPPWLRRAITVGLAADPDQRHASMADLVTELDSDRRRRRRVRVAMGSAAVMAIAGAVLAVGLWIRVPSPDVIEQVRDLEGRARSAASAGRYVFPSLDQPDADTAYPSVRALEELADPSGTADRVAAELRSTFADRLADLGDEYYDREGGRPFALEFYASALVFDPSHPRAVERARLPAWALVDLERRAHAGEFTEIELAVAEPLRVLAEGDDAQAQRVRALVAPTSPLPSTTKAQLAAVFGLVPEDAAPSLAVGPSPPAVVVAKAAAAPPVSTGPEPRPRRGPDVSTVEAASDDVDVVTADRQASGGRAHLQEGRFAAAEASFHRALAADPKNLVAHHGLSEVHYERGEYWKALPFAQKAVALSPKRADLQLQLGDSYFKVGRYNEALRHYEHARALGHARAAGRIEDLKAKLEAPVEVRDGARR